VLIDYAISSDPLVSKAALRGLSRFATGAEAAPLLKVLARAPNAASLEDARIACSRALLQEKNLNIRSSLVRNAFGNATIPEVRAALVGLLPLCADSSAWRTVRETCSDPHPTVRDAALEAVTEWPNMDAWDTLLQTYRKTSDPTERATSLRALVRLASEFNVRPDSLMVKRYEQMFSSARADAEYKLILSALGGAPHPDALTLAVNQLSREGVRAETVAAVKKIAEAIKGTHPDQAAAALKRVSEQL
jgi:HEAT repeat protein